MLPNAKFSAAELKSIFELEFTDLLYLDLQQIDGPWTDTCLVASFPGQPA